MAFLREIPWRTAASFGILNTNCSAYTLLHEQQVLLGLLSLRRIWIQTSRGTLFYGPEISVGRAASGKGAKLQNFIVQWISGFLSQLLLPFIDQWVFSFMWLQKFQPSGNLWDYFCCLTNAIPRSLSWCFWKFWTYSLIQFWLFRLSNVRYTIQWKR